MKVVVMKVVKAVSVDEERTIVTFKAANQYSTEALSFDGQHRIEPGMTLLVTIGPVE